MPKHIAALWASISVAGLLALALVFSGDFRDAAVALLGDNLRNDLVAYISAATSRQPDTADLVPIAHTDVNPFAVNVFLDQEVEDWKVQRTLEMAREAGFRWIKQQVVWYDIETPAKGQYYDVKNDVPNTWAKYDRIVDMARAEGLDLIFRLDTSPDWARPGISKLETPPENFSDYGDFVYNVVTRYKGRVKYYQIWNEPNLPFEWGGEPPNAKDYVRLLQMAYTRAKEADPNAVIIAAALAPTVEMSERGINDLVFLQQMYDAGASQWFDIMGANAYGLRASPDDRRLDEANDVNFSRPVLVREAMVRNGDAGKPIWASEMGWNALPPNFPGEVPWGRVTRDEQAAYIVRAYQRMQQEWPWLGVAAVWHLRMVHDVNSRAPQYYFGIVQNDFTPYPAYDAIKAFANAPSVLYQGFHQTSHYALRFSPGWRQSAIDHSALGQATVASAAGESLDFAFEGADLDLSALPDAQSGRLLVSIDGSAYAANRLPRDGTGQAYVDLYNPTPGSEWRIPVARGLSWQVHTVTIRVAPGAQRGTRAVLDGIVVAGGPPNYARTTASLGLLFVILVALYGFFRLTIIRSSRRTTAAPVVMLPAKVPLAISIQSDVVQ